MGQQQDKSHNNKKKHNTNKYNKIQRHKQGTPHKTYKDKESQHTITTIQHPNKTIKNTTTRNIQRGTCTRTGKHET